MNYNLVFSFWYQCLEYIEVNYGKYKWRVGHFYDIALLNKQSLALRMNNTNHNEMSERSARLVFWIL
jgi:hypothetical protein